METTLSKNFTTYSKHEKQTQNVVTEKEIYKLLLLLDDKCDAKLQTQIISTLGFILLRNNNHADIIIKHDALYEIFLIYLNKGKQSQIGLICNFISVLLYIDEEEGPTRRKSLCLYAQNMIRISGCLSAMRILFMSMMQRDIWSALCRCLADVCRGCALNQSYCSDLMPMCIQHCHRSNIFVIVFLQSLLERHETNNRLFHLNDGMSIFTRETVYNTQYLQLLNTVLENITEQFVNVLSNKVFSELYKMRLEKQSEVAQWASITLYSYEKGKYKNESKLNETNNINCTLNEQESDNTDELLKNVFREVAQYNYYERQNKNLRHAQNALRGHTFVAEKNRQPKTRPEAIDISFSSLVKTNSFAPIKINHTSLMNSTKLMQTTNRFSKHSDNFNPISTSTPKKDVTISKLIDRKIRKRKIYETSKVKNRSLSAKFLDVVNSSCATIINSIKSVFARNETKITNDSCGSFTEYMRIRDQYLGDQSDASNVKCLTCNDTLLLKGKLQSDDCLKITVKKLKLGINMFGCDFKKISKTFWPNEQCMSPTVLYNLYRKLIVK